MQLNKESNSAQYQITKYSASSITVNELEYNESILVSPNLVALWNVSNIENLTRADFQPVIELQPEIILLGTGENLSFPDQAILQDIYQHKIGIEIMTTPAACRTYAALTSECRNVIAALVIK